MYGKGFATLHMTDTRPVTIGNPNRTYFDENTIFQQYGMTGVCLSPALSSSLYVPAHSISFMGPILQTAWVCGASLKPTVRHEGWDRSERCICYGRRVSDWSILDEHPTQVPDAGKIYLRSP